MLSDLLLRLRAIFKRSAVEHELDEELGFHVNRQIETYVSRGMDRDEARRRVRLEFGGLDQVKEEYRDALGVRLLDDLWRDIRYALRTVRRTPGFAATAIIQLHSVWARTRSFSA
jgi:hypothetical protein